MKVGTLNVPTHEVNKNQISKFGWLIRNYKIDELPQLLNVLKGDMSLVGPRPCLPSQIDILDLRKAERVDSEKPGVTGIAQISGVTMEEPERLVHHDVKLMNGLNVRKYLYVLLMTGVHIAKCKLR